MRFSIILITSLTLLSCGDNKKDSKATPGTSESTENTKNNKDNSDKIPPKDPPVPVKKEIKDPVTFCSAGKCEKIERADAEKNGLAIIDMSDNFAPYIFSEVSPGETEKKTNNYRKTWFNLANDVTDEGGRKLKDGEHNYLELFGIPPSMTVLKKRFIHSADSECARKRRPELFKEFGKSLYWNVERPKAVAQAYESAKRAALKYAKSKKIDNLDEFIQDPKNTKNRILRQYRAAWFKYNALNELTERLLCEEVVVKGELRKNLFGSNLRSAVRAFERKHMIFGWGYVNKKMLKYLQNSMLENDYLALKRAMRERVAHSLAIFEDGSIKKRAYFKESTDLIHDIRDQLLKDMGIDTAAKALEFFRNTKDFSRFDVAIKIKPLPPYYKKHMELFAKTSIGDVWYDVPYTKDGKPLGQGRGRLPHVYLYTRWKGQDLPLMKLGTTAGGWQKEFVENEIFLKYKSSDLGAYEWKYIVGAPVWFPPATTPPRELMSFVKTKHGWKHILKKSSFGPSYASAYGLAMGIHTITRKKRNGTEEDLDRGIRTHGSVNYMSILVGHSHGCHRLHNHLSVRMFSNILRRRKHERMGQQIIKDWRHFFMYDGKTQKLELNDKGYYFKLTPPVTITVGRGAILGKVKQPIKDLVRIPNKKYREDVEIGMNIGENGNLEPANTEDATAIDGTATGDASKVKEETEPATAKPDGKKPDADKKDVKPGTKPKPEKNLKPAPALKPATPAMKP